VLSTSDILGLLNWQKDRRKSSWRESHSRTHYLDHCLYSPGGHAHSAGVLLALSPGRPRPLLDETGKALACSISEKTHVLINGVQQGMFIEGRDIGNPVLLFLHGGRLCPSTSSRRSIHQVWNTTSLFAGGPSRCGTLIPREHPARDNDTGTVDIRHHLK